jgi:hypothetical protein
MIMDYEVAWVIVGIVILFSLLGISIPLYFTQSTATPGSVGGERILGVINVISHQYYWELVINGTRYINVAPLGLVTGGAYLLNATSADVTSNMYMVTPGWKVDFQLLPHYTSQYLLYTDVGPGFYVFMNSEYNGPLYNYHVGGFVVLKWNGNYQYMSRDEAVRYVEDYWVDPLNPPAYLINGTVTLTALYGAMWSYGGRASIPGPTFLVPYGENVTLVFKQDNKTMYTTSVLTREVVAGNSGVEVKIMDLVTGRVVASAPLVDILGGTVALSFRATSPAYVYGIVDPLKVEFNEGNPQGNPWIGYIGGYVTPLWGVILVYR